MCSFILFSFVACEKKSDELDLAMIGDMGSLNDKSFIQSTWMGIQKYAKEKKLSSKHYTFIQSVASKDYIINLSNLADDNKDLIVAPGYYFLEPVQIVAKKYPKQKFLLIDTKANQPNILSMLFAANEGSFLMGVCAALKANELHSNKIGFLGGIKSQAIEDFEVGFVQGAKMINPNIEIITKYAGDFSDPRKGEKLASQMYDNGASIIFNVAGLTGKGSIKEAKKRVLLGENVWIIGVDRDQYDDGKYGNGSKSVILTSMIKNLEIATYETIKSVENGTFKGGIKIYNLKNKGILMPKKNPNLKPEWLKIVNSYKQKIINGEIKVNLATTPNP